MGKSTVQENMIIEDIRAGRGVAVVDPHGDLAEKIIEYIPSDRINDVIYFNPADIEYPIAFNVVEQVDPNVRYLIASGLVGVFQKLWADSWGPRLEYILRNTILATPGLLTVIACCIPFLPMNSNTAPLPSFLTCRPSSVEAP